MHKQANGDGSPEKKETAKQCAIEMSKRRMCCVCTQYAKNVIVIFETLSFQSVEHQCTRFDWKIKSRIGARAHSRCRIAANSVESIRVLVMVKQKHSK